MAIGVEGCPGLEHGAGDGEQAVGDGAQRAAMGVAALSEFAVTGMAAGAALGADPGPIIDGGVQPELACMANEDDPPLSAAAGDGCEARQAAQGMVVSPLQGLGGLDEKRGEDDPAGAWPGAEDRRVTPLEPNAGHLGRP